MSGHAARWVEALFDIRMPKRDGNSVVIPENTPVLLGSVRCFRESNILFQRPKRTGVHRDELFGHNHLVEDVERISFYVLVDARRLPRLDFYKIRADKILNYVHSRELTMSGMSPRHFDRFIRDNFQTEFPDLDEDDQVIIRRRLRAKKSLKVAKGTPVIFQLAR